jgi:molybdopterin molybdotransferase
VLPIREALDRCLAYTLPVRPETVPLRHAAGRVLAEDVRASVGLPPWDNSAMDGYALGSAGTADSSCDAPLDGDYTVGPLPVVEVIPAGYAPQRAIGPGEAARIFTGAPVPEGAVAVVMQEDTDLGRDLVRLRARPKPGANIRRAGEDVAVGDVVATRGQTLTAARIGLLAALGTTEVVVAGKPRVAIVSTGDEVIPAGQPLGPGQIYSSNTDQLARLVEDAGGIPVDCGIAPDTLDGVRAAFHRALDADLILTTGGVSVGDFDVVREAMADLGAEMTFWKVRIKPGKPLAHGVIGGVPTFGLPGNPVSCFVNFLVFVRPVLRTSLGDPKPHLPVWNAVLDVALRKRPGRADLQRVRLYWGDDGQLHADTAGSQGSHVLSTLSKASGLALLGPEDGGRAVGETVPVMVFEPGELMQAQPGYAY